MTTDPNIDLSRIDVIRECATELDRPVKHADGSTSQIATISLPTGHRLTLTDADGTSTEYGTLTLVTAWSSADDTAWARLYAGLAADAAPLLETWEQTGVYEAPTIAACLESSEYLAEILR